MAIRIRITFLAALTFFLLGPQFMTGAFAQSGPAMLSDSNEPLPLEFHGFVSQGFIITPGNNFLEGTENGSFEFTEAGLNSTYSFSSRLRMGMQFFVRDFGQLGEYDVQMDWFYLSYRPSDAFGFRAGRTKLPFGLYNEINDIDSARVPILLPQSVYPIANRDFLLAQTGVEGFGYLDLGSGGALDYHVYGGTIGLDIDATSGSPFTINSLTIPYIVGGRLLWETPAQRARLGGSVQFVKLRSNIDAAGTGVQFDLPAALWVLSAEYTLDNWLFASEYSRWHLETRSSVPAILPELSRINERAYVLATHRISPLFQPGVYFSIYYPDRSQRSGGDARQLDLAATLRFDLTPNWLLKLEGHFINGTAGLSPELNGGTPTSELQQNWGMFMIKTTGYF